MSDVPCRTCLGGFPKGNMVTPPPRCTTFAKQRQYGLWGAPMGVVSTCLAQKKWKARTDIPLEARSHEQGLCSPFTKISLTQFLALSLLKLSYPFGITPGASPQHHVLQKHPGGKGVRTGDGLHSSYANSHGWSEPDQAVHLWLGATAFLAESTRQRCCRWYRITAWSHPHSTKTCLPSL